MVRAFIAVPCSDEAKKNLVSLQQNIKGLGEMKLVEEENIHLTLKFLGEVEGAKIAEIEKELGFLLGEKSFPISLAGVGVFPSPNQARVVWAGVGEGRERIEELQRRVDSALMPLGFEKEKKFHAHFTLARVKSASREALRRFLTENSSRPLGSFSAEEADLMESRLSPKGPTYSILQRFSLLHI